MDENLLQMMQADAEAATAVAEEFAGENLTELGLEALRLEQEIDDAERVIKAAKKQLEKIQKYAIPQALHTAGIDEFGFDHGNGRANLKLEIKVVGSLGNAEDEGEAIDYLRSSGLSGAVKSTLTMDFPVAQQEEAETLQATLTEQGRNPSLNRTVHPSTLMAFGREKLKEDPTWDYEKVGLVAFPQAKFTKRR